MIKRDIYLENSQFRSFGMFYRDRYWYVSRVLGVGLRSMWSDRNPFEGTVLKKRAVV